MTVQAAVCVPTASFVTLESSPGLTAARLLAATPEQRRSLLTGRFYAGKFREKHNGGVGIPGGRIKFQSDNPFDTVVAEGGEELGISFKSEQVLEFTVRAKAGRDTRPKIGFSKYLHKDPLPESLASVPDEDIQAHHCLDLVYLIVGIDADPKSLVPADPVEIEEVRLFSLESPPTLAISDDNALVSVLARWVTGELLERPPFLHDFLRRTQA